MYPVAFITTVQPWLTAWVLAISFFLTMLFVALLAKDRTPKQVVLMACVGYIVMVAVVGVGSTTLSGFQMVSVEVVSVSPTQTFETP